MSDLAQAVRDFVELFDSLSIPYVVMGGLAVRAYGIPRPTYDLDFTVSLNRDQLPRFYREAEARGYSVPEAFSKGWVDQVGKMPLVKMRQYLGEEGIDIDVFLAESRYQETLLSRRRLEDMEGTPIWMVSPEDLVLLKLIASRPRDLVDVGDVLFTQGRLDEDYLRTWAAELGVLDRLEQALASQT